MPTARVRKQTYAAGLASAVKTLEALGDGHGTEFFLVIAKPRSHASDASASTGNAYEVNVRSSIYLRDLEYGQDLEWRAEGIIRSSKQHELQTAQLGLRFEQLGDSMLCTVVKEVLVAGISDRKQRFSYRTATSEQVAAKYKWFPAEIEWRNPDAWQRTELLQLLDSLQTHLSGQELKQLSEKVMKKLRSRSTLR